MKYKLIKQFDKDSIPVGDVFDMGDATMCDIEFDGTQISIAWLIKEGYIEPIIEKKTYDDLTRFDDCWCINPIQVYDCKFHPNYCRSETFLTREEAEDEHKRREWTVRPNRFIPEIGEVYFYPTQMGYTEKWTHQGFAGDILVINSGLAFRTEEDCEKAIKEHDLIRLFYTIR